MKKKKRHSQIYYFKQGKNDQTMINNHLKTFMLFLKSKKSHLLLNFPIALNPGR